MYIILISYDDQYLRNKISTSYGGKISNGWLCKTKSEFNSIFSALTGSTIAHICRPNTHRWYWCSHHWSIADFVTKRIGMSKVYSWLDLLYPACCRRFWRCVHRYIFHATFVFDGLGNRSRQWKMSLLLSARVSSWDSGTLQYIIIHLRFMCCFSSKFEFTWLSLKARYARSACAL